MTTISILIIVAIVAATIIYFLTKDTEKINENINNYVPTDEDIDDIDDSDSLAPPTKPALVETNEEMMNRLNGMESPDQDKPFAKISTPDISELPVDIIDKPAPKKKRYYKPKDKPKAKSTIEGEIVTPSKKKPYKKRTPKSE